MMARPYSKDLRDRVVGSVAGGRSCRATAVLFGVSVASVVKWSQRYRATGTAAAKPMGGHRRRILRDERDWLVARIAEKPDLTLRAVLAELAVRGMVVSYGAVWPSPLEAVASRLLISGIRAGIGHKIVTRCGKRIAPVRSHAVIYTRAISDRMSSATSAIWPHSAADGASPCSAANSCFSRRHRAALRPYWRI